MNTRILAAAAALAALVLGAGASAALAQPSNQSGGGVFGVRPSTDLGTSVTVQGAAAGVDRQFAKVDLNKNGEITRGEWGVASLYGPDFANLDLDRNGRISLQEWTAKMSGAPGRGGGASRGKQP
jgi:hypothetical protein